MKLVVFLIVLFILSPAVQAQGNTHPANELPMYGGLPKSAEQQKADQDFIAGVQKTGISLRDASKHAAQTGFIALQQRQDAATAIKRFNQAWLLDTDNGDAYFGFALIAGIRDQNLIDADKFFQMAFAKGNADNSINFEYARFLFSQNKIAEGIPYLEKLYKAYPKSPYTQPMLAFGYLKLGKTDMACRYAKGAVENGEEKLLTGGLAEYCRR